MDREGYKQVERSLGDMQSQIARLNQDLSFYRGLVQPDSLIHVKVQQMQIVPDGPAGAVPPEVRADADRKTGQGGRRAMPRSRSTACWAASRSPWAIAQVSPNHRVSLAYSFSTFRSTTSPYELPAGFEPTRVGVEIHSGKDANHSFRQAFVWKAQGMSVETEANGDIPAKGEADVQTETE